jgi:hypothetical protein
MNNLVRVVGLYLGKPASSKHLEGDVVREVIKNPKWKLFGYGPSREILIVGGKQSLCKAMDIIFENQSKIGFKLLDWDGWMAWYTAETGSKPISRQQFESDFKQLKEWNDDAGFVRTYVETNAPIASAEEIWRATRLAAGVRDA